MKRSLYFLISFLVFLLLASLFFSGYLGHIQRTLIDNVYGGGVASDDIVIVAIDDQSLQEVGRWPWNRSLMADLVKSLSRARVIAIDVGFFESAEGDEQLAGAIANASNVILAMEYTDFEVNQGSVSGMDTLLPVAPLQDAAAELGYINVVTDRDGVTRSYNTAVQGDYVSFAQAVASRAYNRPVTQKSRFNINFVGPPGSFSSVSAKDVLSGAAGVEDVEGKVVIVGATSPDLHDTFFVPTSEGVAMPGVEILANAVQTMVLENDLEEQSATSVLVFMFLLVMLVAAGYYFAGIRTMMVVSAIALLLYFLFAVIMFERDILMNVVYPPLSIVMAFTANLGYAYVTRKKQRDQAVRAFSKYVSTDVVKELLKDPDKLMLGGERRHITVFFSDIRGFTGVSEVLGAEQLVNLLNEYLTEMTDIIIEERGTVDKYMGDAIMAFWGAPLDQPDHAKRACRVSLRMMARLSELQKKWKAEGIPALDIGIGLNTGDAVVGNMGSTQRFDYTAMGDTVNLGSRLEGVNKPYLTHILISESTEAEVRGEFVTRMVDRIKVKGRDGGITMYELIGHTGKVDEKRLKVIKLFEAGLQKYFNKNFDGALEDFKSALHTDPHDGPSRIFVDRCVMYKKNPPANDWDGVFVMKTK